MTQPCTWVVRCYEAQLWFREGVMGGLSAVWGR